MDHTQLQTFLTCPERYKLKYVDQLRKRQEEAHEVPKRFGQAVHTALEAHYRGKEEAECLALFSAQFTPPVDAHETLYTAANGIALLKRYITYAKEVDRDWQILAIEEYGRFELVPGVCYEVKIDLIIQTPTGIWVVDHKTTQKAFTENYWRQFDFSFQLTGYTAYVLQKYHQCSGVILNGLMFGHRQRAYRGEAAGFHCQFQRQIVNRTQDQLDDWRRRIVRTMARLKDVWTTGLWEQSTSFCHWCEFRELCLSVNNAGVREVLYETYNPFAYLFPTPLEEHP